MKTRPIVLIAFEEADNLGIGYLAAVLTRAGFDTRVIDFRYKNGDILKSLISANPILVGFSVIFQYHIGNFRELIVYLRANGIACHFTAGGHYASLRYRELFNLIPSLDSIVRFEGEHTLLDLVTHICSGTGWKNVKGIAYKNGEDEIITNHLRPFEKELDNFPFPQRSPLKEYAFRKKFVTILAGRGCIHSCSFCNVKQFYQSTSGTFKRIRRPEMVVREMELLYHEKNCSVFLFLDDDFPVKTNQGSAWVESFCNELKIKGLHEKVVWKINCRPDEVDQESFALMKANGLFHVFLGIEDGTDEGLKRLNKHLTVSKSLEGINTLNELGLAFDYGFMLFQPSSTFSSIHDNLSFLRKICSKGSNSVTFLKMLPYFETRIEMELREEGRLTGVPGFYDYDFLDDSLTRYFDFVDDAWMEWLRDSSGLVNLSKWARIYLTLFPRYYMQTPEFNIVANNVRKTVSQSNLFLLDTMQELSGFFEGQQSKIENKDYLINSRRSINTKHKEFRKSILDSIYQLKQLAERQEWYSRV